MNEHEHGPRFTLQRLLHATAWFGLSALLVSLTFVDCIADGPTCVALAVVAAYFGIGTLSGGLKGVLYFAVFAPFVFFGAMFIAMFVALSFT